MEALAMESLMVLAVHFKLLVGRAIAFAKKKRSRDPEQLELGV